MARNLTLTPYAMDANAVFSEIASNSPGILYIYGGPVAGGDPEPRDGWACWRFNYNTSEYARVPLVGTQTELYIHFPFYNVLTATNQDFFRIYNNNKR